MPEAGFFSSSPFYFRKLSKLPLQVRVATPNSVNPQNSLNSPNHICPLAPVLPSPWFAFHIFRLVLHAYAAQILFFMPYRSHYLLAECPSRLHFFKNFVTCSVVDLRLSPANSIKFLRSSAIPSGATLIRISSSEKLVSPASPLLHSSLLPGFISSVFFTTSPCCHVSLAVVVPSLPEEWPMKHKLTLQFESGKFLVKIMKRNSPNPPNATNVRAPTPSRHRMG